MKSMIKSTNNSFSCLQFQTSSNNFIYLQYFQKLYEVVITSFYIHERSGTEILLNTHYSSYSQGNMETSSVALYN